MPYSELIKDFSHIRDYMREFFVYGFKSREEFAQKSARSYDNERRRIESWLSEYMSFRQDASGKNVFISVDSRHVPRNPLYKAWKAASFTKNDISLHFLLLDILSCEEPKTISEILTVIDRDYLCMFSDAAPIDESTLRKKLKEYVDLGLVHAQRQGKQLAHRLPSDTIHLDTWLDALSFFSEVNPLGVVGSFLLDKFCRPRDLFSFKHHYLLFTLDSGIMAELLTSMHEGRKVALDLWGRRSRHPHRVVTLPMKIYISTQGGRQYLAGFNMRTKKLRFYRLDGIQKVKALDVQSDYALYKDLLPQEQLPVWGVATGNSTMEHIQMTLRIAPEDDFIIKRLEREKRHGAVEQIDEITWRFTAAAYDAQELLPWLRTFIGRIASLTCSNKIVEERFWSDVALLAEMYGGDGHAV